MIKLFILMALLLHLICIMVYDTSPCSEYFIDMTEFGTSDILGQIEIPFPPENKDFYLRVVLDIDKILSPKDWYIRLELARSIQESIRAVQQGKPLLYHVYFSSHEPIPTLSAIWFNNQKYCPTSGNIRGNIELGHIVFANEEPFSHDFWLNPSYQNVIIYRINNPTRYRLNYPHLIYPRSTTISERESSNNVYPQIFQFNNNSNINNNECGINSHTESHTLNLLISNGQKTFPGQWPWLVALFVIRNKFEFQCAGTILTNRHVLTAGHCLKFTNNAIPSNMLLVALGRFKLHQWREEGTVNREVASYKIHPEYEHAITGDSDLAILILRMSVEYSPFIRPICLWSGSTILQNVVDRTGYVVGWGRDESGYPYTEDPRMARVPIVSHEECLWSDPIFVTLTSNRTFCAGLLDGSGPCNGDSGSGLVLFDAATNRYQLRGIVSRAVFGNEQLCNLKKYVVYVDVAKYVTWIQEQISVT